MKLIIDNFLRREFAAVRRKLTENCNFLHFPTLSTHDAAEEIEGLYRACFQYAVLDKVVKKFIWVEVEVVILKIYLSRLEVEIFPLK